MRVLVTGANGHIGSHVVRQCQQQGHMVRAFVRPGADCRGLQGLDPEYAEGDIMDAGAVSRAAEGMDAIIHMAAVYRTMAKNADDIVAPAIQGAENVFQAASEHGVKRVVYTSSAASVGFSYDPQELRTGDDWNNDPHNPYYQAKTYSEQRAQALSKEHGIHLVVICPTLVLGPGDYRVTPSNQLVRDWLNGVGQTYRGGLNLVDVRDVAAAHVAALTKGENGRRYIVGSENLTVKEVGKLMQKLTGRKPLHIGLGRGPMLWSAKWTERLCNTLGTRPPITYDLIYEVSERYAYFDTSEANRTFGITPRSTESALRDAIAWLIHLGKVKPAIAEKLKEQFPAPAPG